MKRFFVTKEVAYADGGGGAGTALTPDQLLDGSIGVYGILPSSNKNVLVTAANDDAGYTEYVIAMGTVSGGPIVSPPIKVADTKAGFPNSVAPVTETAQVTHVGYNGTTGSLGTPTIVDGDWGEVKLVLDTFGINQELKKVSFEASNLAAGASDYVVAKGVVAAFDSRDSNTHFLGNVDIITNSTGSTFGAGTETFSVTNGSTALTTSADPTIAPGDYVIIFGSTYQIAQELTTTSYVLDRPYKGATVAASANGNIQDGTAPTEAGLVFTAQSPSITFKVAVSGVLEDATVTYTTAGSEGVGTYLTVSKEENLGRAFLGYHDQIDRRRPAPQTNAVSGSEYDIYRIEALNTRPAAHEMNATFQTEVKVAACFVDGAGTSGQATFQTVIETIHSLSGGALNPA